MGEASDRIVDSIFFGKPGRARKTESFQKRSGDYKWRTKDGVIDMRNMSITHLRNAMYYAKRKGNTAKYDQLREVLSEKENSND